MFRLFYKFSVSSNSIKFTEMKLVDDEDSETMITLYCSSENLNSKPIQLFAELIDVEPVQNATSLSQ